MAKKDGDSTGPSLRDRHVAMISIGGVIGASLFVGSSSAIAIAGNGALLSYFLAGLIVLCVTRMLGEMTVESPLSGTFVGQIRRALGHRTAFVAGWIYWVMWATILGIEAIAIAGFLSPWVNLPYLATSLGTVALVTGVNILSLRGFGEFEYWFSFLKIMTIVVFIILAGSALMRGLGRPFLSGGAESLWAEGLLPHGAFGLLAVIPGIMLSMAGAEIATIAAADTPHPARNVARATRSVVLRIMIFYLLSIGLILLLVPSRAIVIGQSPFLSALDRIGVPFAALLITGVMLIATFSALNSGVYICARILHELASQGDAPAFFLTTASSGRPVRGILCGSLFAVVIVVVAALAPARIFSLLVNTSGAFILFDYVLVVLAHIRLRRKAMQEGRESALPMWGFPWLSYMTLASILLALATMFFASPHTRQEILLSLLGLFVVVGIEWFSFGKRPAGKLPLNTVEQPLSCTTSAQRHTP
ncbi:MAG: amino acid permease [Acetobacter sp.]|uniref:amino acid permease n=1 Tax=Acetobacter sp. TaxID=440 RepID=UPI0039EAD212